MSGEGSLEGGQGRRMNGSVERIVFQTYKH